MMYQYQYVSILPPEIKLQRKLKERRILYIVSGVALLLVLSLVFFSLLVTTILHNVELSRIESQKTSVENEMVRYQKYEQINKQVQSMESLIKQAMGTTPEWDNFLRDIGVYIPNGVWLTNLSGTYTEGKTGELILRGQAYDNTLVSEYLNTLSTLPGVKDVRCQFTSEAMDKTTPIIQFEIKALIAQDPSTQPQGKGGDTNGKE